MPIKTICPSCRMTAEHPDHLRGYQAGCPFCGSPLVVGLKPLPTVGAENPWGQLELCRPKSILPAALLATAGIMLLILLIGGGGIALNLAARNRFWLPAAGAPIVKEQASQAPAPPAAEIPPAAETVAPTPSVAQDMIAELSDGKTWTERSGRSFRVNYRMLNDQLAPDSLLNWVVESANGQRATRRVMTDEMRDTGTLAARLILERGEAPYTTYLELSSRDAVGPGTRVTEPLTLEETAPESSLLPTPPPFVAATGPRTNPYTVQLEGLRRHLENVQRQKAEHDQRMQRFGGRAANPFERMEQDIQRQIERLEQRSQQWEQENAAR